MVRKSGVHDCFLLHYFQFIIRSSPYRSMYLVVLTALLLRPSINERVRKQAIRIPTVANFFFQANSELSQDGVLARAYQFESRINPVFSSPSIFFRPVRIDAKGAYYICHIRPSVRPSVPPSARTSAAPTGRLSVKFDISPLKTKHVCFI
jgi:hypothetical protein